MSSLCVLAAVPFGSAPMEGPLQTLLIQPGGEKSAFQRSRIVDVALFHAALWLTPTRQHVPFHTQTMNMQDFVLLIGLEVFMNLILFLLLIIFLIISFNLFPHSVKRGRLVTSPFLPPTDIWTLSASHCLLGHEGLCQHVYP